MPKTRYEFSPRVYCVFNATIASIIHSFDEVIILMTQRSLRESTLDLSLRLLYDYERYMSAPKQVLWRYWRHYRALTSTSVCVYCVFFSAQSHGHSLYFEHSQRPHRLMAFLASLLVQMKIPMRCCAAVGVSTAHTSAWCIFHGRSKIALETQPLCEMI